MHRALLELTIDGVETSRDFHLRLMEDPEFRRGEIEIQWLERRLASLVALAPPEAALRAAAIAAALFAARDQKRGSPADGAPAAKAAQHGAASDGSSWKRVGRAEGLR
jgi:acetyl-CoA carboxylase biotin carboxylase subunit